MISYFEVRLADDVLDLVDSWFKLPTFEYGWGIGHGYGLRTGTAEMWGPDGHRSTG